LQATDRSHLPVSFARPSGAAQVARRKALYLGLHPETAKGVAGADARWDATAKLATASFVADTAEKTGAAERSIRREAERGEKIAPSSRIRDACGGNS
jgi:hypothetical protein